MTVIDGEGEAHNASVYVARTDMIDDTMKPTASYRDPIVEAARVNNLPADYVAKLARTPVADAERSQ